MSYDMRISECSSDMCASDLDRSEPGIVELVQAPGDEQETDQAGGRRSVRTVPAKRDDASDHQRAAGDRVERDRPQQKIVDLKDGKGRPQRDREDGVGKGHDRRMAANEVQRSEEHTSELQSLMRISYAVFCLKKKKTQKN